MRTVVMALQFPPRGGSAQVVRYLAPDIAVTGWSVSLVSPAHQAAPRVTASVPVDG